MSEQPFIPLAIAVVTVSDSRTLQTDTSGAAIVECLIEAGHSIARRDLVPDDAAVLRETFRRLIQDERSEVVIATGGTGITARDVTPEALAPFVTKTIPGFGELFRWLSYADIGAATIQSRAEAALCSHSLVFLLPGSTKAVRLALDKIVLPQLDSRTRPCNFVDLLARIRHPKPS